MKKLLLISDKEESFLLRRVKRFFESDSIKIDSCEVEEVINSAKPDLVYLNLIKPVNGPDMMGTLSSIDLNTRLRVTIIKSSSIKINLLSLIFPFESVDTFIHNLFSFRRN